MGRGESKANGSFGTRNVMTQSGDVVELSEPLMYGKEDSSISKAQRAILENQEKKRATAKIEYGLVVDENGTIVGPEAKGNGGHVTFDSSQFVTNGVMTHNHPRGKGSEGVLGGTFSEGDLRVFGKTKLKTMRASAAEGTYSITKEKNFNKTEFDAHVTTIRSHAQNNLRRAYDAIDNKWLFLDHAKYTKARNSAFNDFLVELHNGLIKGQKQCGYTYTLERR